MKTFHVFFPYAYDRIQDGSGKGSMARCDALLKLLKTIRPDDHVFVLTAGFTKVSPNKPAPGVPVSLAEQMHRYLRSKDSEALTDRYPVAWGTLDETKEAIYIIEQNARAKSADKVVVWVSTNLGHMPRVRLCWLLLKPETWDVKFVTAKHSFIPKEWVQETIKFFQYVYLFAAGKARST